MAEYTGRRRAPRRPWWRTLTSVKARLVMTLGLLVGFVAVGTSAFWTDQATVDIGPVSTGTLDLEIGPAASTFLLDGPGGKWDFTVVQLADVLPGESVAMDLYIKNGGTVPLTFTGEAWSTTNDLSSAAGTALLVSTTRGATAGNTTSATGYRTGTCGGGVEPWWVDHRISTTPRVLTPSDTPVTLAKDQVLRVCMLVTFPASAPNSLQQKTTTLRATFDAEQP